MAWPVPSAPVRKSRSPSTSSTGRTRSTSSSSPPTISVRVPSSARTTPPETGLSTRPSPSSASRRPSSARRHGARAAHVDDDRPRRERRRDAPLPVEDGIPHCRVVGQHRHDDLRGGEGARLGGCVASVLGREARLPPRVRVVHGQRMAGGREVPGHGPPHLPEADEADVRRPGTLGSHRVGHVPSLGRYAITSERAVRSSTFASDVAATRPSGPMTSEDSSYQLSGARAPQNDRQRTSDTDQRSGCQVGVARVVVARVELDPVPVRVAQVDEERVGDTVPPGPALDRRRVAGGRELVARPEHARRARRRRSRGGAAAGHGRRSARRRARSACA